MSTMQDLIHEALMDLAFNDPVMYDEAVSQVFAMIKEETGPLSDIERDLVNLDFTVQENIEMIKLFRIKLENIKAHIWDAF